MLSIIKSPKAYLHSDLYRSFYPIRHYDTTNDKQRQVELKLEENGKCACFEFHSASPKTDQKFKVSVPMPSNVTLGTVEHQVTNTETRKQNASRQTYEKHMFVVSKM